MATLKLTNGTLDASADPSDFTPLSQSRAKVRVTSDYGTFTGSTSAAGGTDAVLLATIPKSGRVISGTVIVQGAIAAGAVVRIGDSVDEDRFAKNLVISTGTVATRIDFPTTSAWSTYGSNVYSAATDLVMTVSSGSTATGVNVRSFVEWAIE